MNLNRRHVLLGLGAVGLGGGGLLSSGAFTTVEATREVEVNVLADEDIADVVDVLLRVGQFNGIAVTEDGADQGNLPSDPENPDELFPTENEFYNIDGFISEPDDVSVIASDVRLIFGPPGRKLPANSTVTYDSLFVVVNRDGGDGREYEVTFEYEGEILDSAAYADGGGDSKVVDSDTTEEVGVAVRTGEESRLSENELTIRVTPDSQ